MGLLTFVGRVVLVVLNIIFKLVSLTLIIAGFIVRFAHDWLKPKVQPVLGKISEAVKATYGTELDTDKFEMGSLVSTLCYVSIALGIALLAVSFIGCCGACCNFTTLMLVYAIVLIALLIGQAVAVVLTFATPDVIKKQMRSALSETMHDYDGIQGTTLAALGWNWAQQDFDCCGADSYKDFEEAASPYKDKDVHDNAPINGDMGDVVAPIACCKKLPTSAAARDSCAGKSGSLTDSESNWKYGCVDAIWERIMNSSTYFYLATVFCFVAQVVLIIFACLGYKNRGVTGGLV